MASSEKSWSSAVAECRSWAATNPHGFKVEFENEPAARINFAAPCGSFYITVPGRGLGFDYWVHIKGVWSDDNSCIPCLSAEMDYFCEPKRTLAEVLVRAGRCVSEREGAGEGAKGSGSESEEEEEEEEEEEDFDAYYGGADDEDMADDTVTVKEKQSPMDLGPSADDFFTGQGSPAAVHRLLSDLKQLNKSAGKYGISGKPSGDNLFLWEVELSDFEKGTLLHKDLENYAKHYKRKPVVELEMKFPKDYPMNPPFVRITRPRFQFLTGHVTIGGSICMQMLTRSGWSPSNDIESILVQVRAEIMSDSRARLDPSPCREYSEHEARDAFERMVRRYGWGR